MTMMITTKLRIAYIILFISSISFFLVFGYSIGSGDINIRPLMKNILTSECKNDSLVNAVHCLNDDFNSWYFFNISQSGKKLSEEELINEGGVCSQASEWYLNHAQQLGYEGKLISFFASDSDVGHQVVVLYDKQLENYCIIDQKNILACLTLSNSDAIN